MLDEVERQLNLGDRVPRRRRQKTNQPQQACCPMDRNIFPRAGDGNGWPARRWRRLGVCVIFSRGFLAAGAGFGGEADVGVQSGVGFSGLIGG